jgi:hypothetical protein
MDTNSDSNLTCLCQGFIINQFSSSQDPPTTLSPKFQTEGRENLNTIYLVLGKDDLLDGLR